MPNDKKIVEKDSDKVIFKDKHITIKVNSRGYYLEFDKKDMTYHSDLEGVLRTVLKLSFKDNLQADYDKSSKNILDTIKSLEKAELKVKKIANSIPFREIPEAPDVNVDAKDYFDRTRED